MPQLRENNGKREWRNSRGVWQEFTTEQELRDMPPVPSGTPPVAVGIESFLKQRRELRDRRVVESKA